MNKLFSVFDIFFTIILISIFIIWIGIIYFHSNDSTNVEIRQNNEIYKIVPINENKIITVTTRFGKIEIEIKNKKVRVKSSACPNKICMKFGWIDKTNDIIVCLPSKVLIQIIGKQNQIDAKSY